MVPDTLQGHLYTHHLHLKTNFKMSNGDGQTADSVFLWCLTPTMNTTFSKVLSTYIFLCLVDGFGLLLVLLRIGAGWFAGRVGLCSL
jgi:hypothetical protein